MATSLPSGCTTSFEPLSSVSSFVVLTGPACSYPKLHLLAREYLLTGQARGLGVLGGPLDTCVGTRSSTVGAEGALVEVTFAQ